MQAPRPSHVSCTSLRIVARAEDPLAHRIAQPQITSRKCVGAWFRDCCVNTQNFAVLFDIDQLYATTNKVGIYQQKMIGSQEI